MNQGTQRFAVAIELIRSKQSAGAAFTLACDASGMEDKGIYSALDIDAGSFSRMKSGAATLRGDLVKQFCDVVGNTVYVEWFAWQVGCTLVVTQTEAERQNQLLREENAALRRVLQGGAA
ncbi:transcriptional regulator [Variovorax paradoxus]|nr:transcriptional regulator [Variovorax paradoxus]MBT2299237.1 transcriptional regulator [Variovorax paradoxus]